MVKTAMMGMYSLKKSRIWATTFRTFCGLAEKYSPFGELLPLEL